MAENPVVPNPNAPLDEPVDLNGKIFVSGREVPQAPSRELPTSLVDAVLEMHRISAESEKTQEGSGVESE